MQQRSLRSRHLQLRRKRNEARGNKNTKKNKKRRKKNGGTFVFFVLRVERSVLVCKSQSCMHCSGDARYLDIHAAHTPHTHTHTHTPTYIPLHISLAMLYFILDTWADGSAATSTLLYKVRFVVVFEPSHRLPTTRCVYSDEKRNNIDPKKHKENDKQDRPTARSKICLKNVCTNEEHSAVSDGGKAETATRNILCACTCLIFSFYL